MAETKKTAEQLYAQAQEAQKQLEQLRAQQPGAYESSYGAQIDALIAQLDSRPGFSYDVNGDPLYRQYAEQYQRQGKAAMEDTLGAAAGLTGGYGSSYATTAASPGLSAVPERHAGRGPGAVRGGVCPLSGRRHRPGKAAGAAAGPGIQRLRRMAGPGAGPTRRPRPRPWTTGDTSTTRPIRPSRTNRPRPTGSRNSMPSIRR